MRFVRSVNPKKKKLKSNFEDQSIPSYSRCQQTISTHLKLILIAKKKHLKKKINKINNRYIINKRQRDKEVEKNLHYFCTKF